MIRTHISMRIREGAEAEFEDAWLDSANEIAAAPGNLRQELLRDAVDRSVYLVTSDWESEEALSEFSASTGRVELSARLEELRETAQRNVFQLVQRVEGER